MKLTSLIIAVAVACSSLVNADTLQQEYRTFTGTNGKEIEAVKSEAKL